MAIPTRWPTKRVLRSSSRLATAFEEQHHGRAEAGEEPCLLGGHAHSAGERQHDQAEDGGVPGRAQRAVPGLDAVDQRFHRRIDQPRGYL